MKKLFAAALLAAATVPAHATVWMIGDNDGFGMGIPDNGMHPFNGYTAGYDGRSAAEMAATNGAQYTDTYSTTHPGYGPQPGTTATFTFDAVGSGWTQGSMWFDMADFQASTFGSTLVKYNGILQNWSFNDGFPNTKVRYFDLAQDVLDSINNTGKLIVTIDRNGSGDFYGFDFAALSNLKGSDTNINDVPEPASMALLGLGLIGIAGARRRNRV